MSREAEKLLARIPAGRGYGDRVTQELSRVLRECEQIRGALQEALSYCDQAFGENDQYASDRERLMDLAYPGRRENPEAEIPGPHNMGA